VGAVSPPGGRLDRADPLTLGSVGSGETPPRLIAHRDPADPPPKSIAKRPRDPTRPRSRLAGKMLRRMTRWSGRNWPLVLVAGWIVLAGGLALAYQRNVFDSRAGEVVQLAFTIVAAGMPVIAFLGFIPALQGMARAILQPLLGHWLGCVILSVALFGSGTALLVRAAARTYVFVECTPATITARAGAKVIPCGENAWLQAGTHLSLQAPGRAPASHDVTGAEVGERRVNLLVPSVRCRRLSAAEDSQPFLGCQRRPRDGTWASSTTYRLSVEIGEAIPLDGARVVAAATKDDEGIVLRTGRSVGSCFPEAVEIGTEEQVVLWPACHRGGRTIELDVTVCEPRLATVLPPRLHEHVRLWIQPRSGSVEPTSFECE